MKKNKKPDIRLASVSPDNSIYRVREMLVDILKVVDGQIKEHGASGEPIAMVLGVVWEKEGSDLCYAFRKGSKNVNLREVRSIMQFAIDDLQEYESIDRGTPIKRHHEDRVTYSNGNNDGDDAA